MTADQVRAHVQRHMSSIWPGATITIEGAGSERISCTVVLPSPVGTLSDYHNLTADLDSDNDSYLYFHGESSGALIAIPHP